MTFIHLELAGYKELALKCGKIRSFYYSHPPKHVKKKKSFLLTNGSCFYLGGQMLRKLYYNIPASWRFTARRLYYLPIDIWDSVTGKRPKMVPPRGKIFTGSGDFIQQGDRLLGLFKKLGKLKSSDSVLDIGSGIGRVAVALTKYLNASGKYQGFDPIERGIRWCQDKITPDYSNFKFDYIPLKNDLYRDDGPDASQFTFPYTDSTFDFILLTSVFTHMTASEVEHYLSEIKRVLNDQGTVFATFFILTEESKKRSLGKPFSFAHQKENHWLMDKNVVSANVAFEEQYLFETLIKAQGLRIEAFHPGFWSGRDKAECPDFQDILILKKI